MPSKSLLDLPDELHVCILHYMLAGTYQYSITRDQFSSLDGTRSYSQTAYDILRPLTACKRLYIIAYGEITSISIYHIPYKWFVTHRFDHQIAFPFPGNKLRALHLDIRVKDQTAMSSMLSTFLRINTDLKRWFPLIGLIHIQWKMDLGFLGRFNVEEEKHEIVTAMTWFVEKLRLKQLEYLQISRALMATGGAEEYEGRIINMTDSGTKEIMDFLAGEARWEDVVRM